MTEYNFCGYVVKSYARELIVTLTVVTVTIFLSRTGSERNPSDGLSLEPG
jgi:hypothetical protein